MASSYRIVIADDHPLFRAALRGAVASVFDDSDINEASSLDEALDVLNRNNGCDLIFLDLRMPGAHGFSGLLYLRGHFPETPIVVVSGIEDGAIMRRAVQLGASGFIPKSTSAPNIVEAVRHINAGEIWLPPQAHSAPDPIDTDYGDLSEKVASLSSQQFKVLTLIARGLLNKQIAHELDLSLSTVKAHTTVVLKKLGLQRRTQLIAAMRDLDLSPPPPGGEFLTQEESA